MGYFDFSGIDDPTSRYERAYDSQGFERPTDRSPFDPPAGWYGGGVDQTGGMVMVRNWSTLPGHGIDTHHDTKPGRRYEYKVAYGTDPHVGLQRYEWNANRGFYEFDKMIDDTGVQENTDRAKAHAALELMREHGDKAL